MRSLSGILGAVFLLLLLPLAGASVWMEGLPDWRILLAAAAACGIASVVCYKLSAKPK